MNILKNVTIIFILIIVSSACGTKWFIIGNKRDKIERTVRIQGGDNIIPGDTIALINVKGEYFGFLLHDKANLGRVSYPMNYAVLKPGKLKRKNLTLTTEHPGYISDTIKIKRSLRFGPLIGDLALTGLSGGWLAPVIGLDFYNNNIWKIKKRNSVVNTVLTPKYEYFAQKVDTLASHFMNQTATNDEKDKILNDLLLMHELYSQETFSVKSSATINQLSQTYAKNLVEVMNIDKLKFWSGKLNAPFRDVFVDAENKCEIQLSSYVDSIIYEINSLSANLQLPNLEHRAKYHQKKELENQLLSCVDAYNDLKYSGKKSLLTKTETSYFQDVYIRNKYWYIMQHSEDACQFKKVWEELDFSTIDTTLLEPISKQKWKEIEWTRKKLSEYFKFRFPETELSLKDKNHSIHKVFYEKSHLYNVSIAMPYYLSKGSIVIVRHDFPDNTEEFYDKSKYGNDFKLSSRNSYKNIFYRYFIVDTIIVNKSREANLRRQESNNEKGKLIDDALVNGKISYAEHARRLNALETVGDKWYSKVVFREIKKSPRSQNWEFDDWADKNYNLANSPFFLYSESYQFATMIFGSEKTFRLKKGELATNSDFGIFDRESLVDKCD